MNEDYLWDKSGEPDPQIQELEELLGTLRYQPRPLKLGGSSPASPRNYLALLAIAATVAVALLAGGIWLLLPQHDALIPAVAYVTPAARIPDLPLAVFPPASPKRRPPIRAKHERQEALAAKQQLMFALRFASERLNAAYRRTQTPSQIRNQHRAG
jgi:hypothetical protein